MSVLMATVLRPPTRAQLAAFLKTDQQAIRAFEDLFALFGLDPGSIVYSGAAAVSGAIPADGSAVSRALYPNLFNALLRTSAVTITVASPGVVTWIAHGLPANTPIYFTTNGVLPTGLNVGVEYFVKTVLSTNTLTLSATSGGTVINTSGVQSGVHTATAYPFGAGDGSTTFNLPTVSAVGGCNAFIVY